MCYSWWILSALVTIDRAHWIDLEKLAGSLRGLQAPTAEGTREDKKGASLWKFSHMGLEVDVF